MNTRTLARGAALGAAGYGAYFGLTWYRYGHPREASGEEADPLLDSFLPVFDVVERHSVRVAAPAGTTLFAACEQDLQQSRIVRAIFKAREWIMGAGPGAALPGGLLRQMKSLGWGVLAEVPGREVLMGAVTRPWEPDVVFRALPAAEFARFDEPGYVKIAWTLRADPAGPAASIFRTETRAATTDARARAKFRIYWSLFSPGIALTRRLSLGPLKKEAERRYRTGMV
jgi:hypothetical protein